MAALGHVNPTCRRIHLSMGACAESNGGVVGRDLTIVGGSVRWTGKLSDRVDVAARGKADKTLWGRVMVRGSSKLAEIAQIHRSKVKKPLLVVVLAERGHSGGAIGSGSNCRRSSKG